MSVELRYLAYTAFLTAALWIPYIISQVQTNGLLTPANYADPTPRKVPRWGTGGQSRPPQCGRGLRAVRRARSDRPCRRQGERDDCLLRDLVLLASPDPRRRPSCRPALHSDGGVHPGIRGGLRAVLGSRQLISGRNPTLECRERDQSARIRRRSRLRTLPLALRGSVFSRRWNASGTL